MFPSKCQLSTLVDVEADEDVARVGPENKVWIEVLRMCHMVW
jgi:hypothetical protein